MTQDLFTRFNDLVSEKFDLNFPAAKQVFFESRLRERLSLTGHGDYESYYNYLLEMPDEMQSLVQGITVNETRFFRNPDQFKALKEKIFPEMIEKKNREVVRSWGDETRNWKWGERHPAMNFRIWSAGCSTGEEAWSILFTLLDTLKFPRAWEIDIMATDINRAVLDKGRVGIYGKESVKQIRPDALGRYMDRQGEDYIVKDYPASLVNFYEANLKDISKTYGLIKIKGTDGPETELAVKEYFDIIFCRNVMIYFDRVAQSSLVNSLYDCLKPGGFLFTGDSEPLHLFEHRFKTVTEGGVVYYVKPS